MLLLAAIKENFQNILEKIIFIKSRVQNFAIENIFNL